MRLRWVGDSRDYVKWDCIFEYAADCFVLYVPMLRRIIDPVCKHKEVQHHLDQRKSLKAFETLFSGGFEVYEFSGEEYCQKSADAYFEGAVHRVRELQGNHKVLVFIDPDTGLQPDGGARNEHLRLNDLQRMWEALKRGDQLVVYQHASHRRFWREKLREAASIALSLREDCIKAIYFDERLAKDVCFLVLEKNA